MYSALKNIQILVALLKEKGVQHVVISPGGVSMPIIRSIESDPFFTCYSVVDERSAAYFAMGVAQSIGKPVAMVCTSGTAVCNYMSGVTEAFYQGVPLVVITGDRHPYLYRQMETQHINQIGIFEDVCRKSVMLPAVYDDNDFWYCQRLANEALLELDHHGSGPVHIDVHIGMNMPPGILEMPVEQFTAESLPHVNSIRRISSEDSHEIWRQRIEELKSYEKILLIFGQNRPYSKADIEHIECFEKKYNCVLSVEHLSNLNCDRALVTYPFTETASLSMFGKLVPDLVISLGYNFAAANMKTYLRYNRGKFKHWSIDETGNVKDVFMGLSTIFECSPSQFFAFFARNAPEDSQNDRLYRDAWAEVLGRITFQNFPFSNLYVAQEFSRRIPANSILHLGILNSIRHMQFFNIDKSIEVFANIGALGIDGSMSTFIGQAAVSEKPCFLVIGDLSFFYDMNSARIRHLGGNARILMVNNGGGGEFLAFPGIKRYPNINNYTAARHGTTAKGWVESLGIGYRSASDKEGLIAALDDFVSPSDRPLFLEVFTDMEQDGEVHRQFYTANRLKGSGEKSKDLIKEMSKSVIGEKATGKAIRIVKTIMNK